MGIADKFNLRKHRGVLRGLDYTNMPPDTMQEVGLSPSGRASETLYEGSRRVPTTEEMAGHDGAEHRPMPTDRPHPRAQWDDVEGRWILWSTEAGDWVPVETEG